LGYLHFACPEAVVFPIASVGSVVAVVKRHLVCCHAASVLAGLLLERRLGRLRDQTTLSLAPGPPGMLLRLNDSCLTCIRMVKEIFHFIMLLLVPRRVNRFHLIVGIIFF
jgi:hypothetical protein